MASSVAVKPSSKPLQSNDGFPKAFVASLKVLFDILDEDGDGLVHVKEIEKRWASEGGISGLPFGVLNGLRKASPKNGKLSFERFCSGLKMSLNSDRGVGKAREDRHPNTATVRPNNVVRPMAVRARSAPELPRAPNGRPGSLSSNTDPITKWELAVQKARNTEDKLYSSTKYRVKGDTRHQKRSALSDINSNDPFHPRIQKDLHYPSRTRRNEGVYVRYPPTASTGPHDGPPGRMGLNPQRRSHGALHIHPSSPGKYIC